MNLYKLLHALLKTTKFLIRIVIRNKKRNKTYLKNADIYFVPKIYNEYKKYLKNKYPDYWIFVPFWPWGDFLICCSLLEQFKKEHSGKILIFYVNDEQLKFINSLNFADKTIKMIPELYYSLNLNNEFMNNKNILEKGTPFEMSHMAYEEANINKSGNFTELYAKMLDIKDIKFSKPVIQEKLKKELDLKFKSISNNKKVVMITPHSHSYDEREINVHYWIKLGKKFEKKGYKVIFNSKRYITYKDFETLFLPMFEQAYISTLCDLNISIRSGYTDIISIFGTKNQIVLYPESRRFVTISQEAQLREMSRIFKINRNMNFEDNMFNWTSVNKMFNKDYLELVIKYENTDEEIKNYIRIENMGEKNDRYQLITACK